MAIATETVACKLCGEPTPMLGTKMCNSCWELDKRIRMNPDIAAKIMKEIENER